ncbi:MAG TPA: glycosyltransferase family 4 protein [Usitatibacter sp.]|nr:glycosyltransferase family 4 protein [Usitatibacter sp.]
MARRDPSRIVMVGTAAETRGGISAVVASYRNAGLFARWPIDYVESHRDGSRAEKLACALRGLAKLAWLALRHPHAILHVHVASRASFWRKCAYMTLGRIAGWPLVFHLHGGGFADFYERECSRNGRRAIRFFLDRAACVVTVSERWSAWVRQITPNPRVTCIPNAVAMPKAHPARREPALIAFVGRCEESKGILDLLEALAEVRVSIPEARLECAGDGNLAALGERADELGVGERVNTLGWIGPAQRDGLLARAAIFALPSHAEGLPMALLEAMAAGCPVVAASCGGIPDLVTDGVNGLLVPPGDVDALAQALHRVLVDRELASRLGREARATVARRYTAEAALERLEQLYSGLGVRRGHAPMPSPARRFQEIS